MPEKSYPMTAEGKEKLQAELKNLKLVKRPEVIERIKVARSFGDLSENSEYDAAKDEQSHVEDRIAQVEDMLKYAQVVDADRLILMKFQLVRLLPILKLVQMMLKPTLL